LPCRHRPAAVQRCRPHLIPTTPISSPLPATSARPGKRLYTVNPVRAQSRGSVALRECRV